MGNYDLTNFKRLVNELGLTLFDRQYEQFIRYYEMLVEWNNVMNLTAITEYDEVIVKHFADSLSLVKAVDKEKLIRGSLKMPAQSLVLISKALLLIPIRISNSLPR